MNELTDLVEIFDPEVQICSWQRQLDPAIAQYLCGLELNRKLQALETLVPTDPPEIGALPEHPGKTALLDDLALLRDILCELLGSEAAGMRLARLGHAMCPGWHVDKVGIRLVCTYQGPGTQWLEDQNVDRGQLRSEQVRNGRAVEATPGEIVLLKGAIWQGNQGYGAIHRSPELTVNAPLRTLVTLDPFWRE
ncbi:DUF1826 domain-containing protein [Ferrimonas marina]|uniref:DUF1826 domain-containing protein n=1 Tax=Ferrimonas marina TaxID=299255 RepID=UPI00190EFCD9|nr:DUF1826 domain-containing protein [Ferrimonas marina]